MMDSRHRDKSQSKRVVDTLTADSRGPGHTSTRAVPLPVANRVSSRSTASREVTLLIPANPVAGSRQPSTHHGGGGSQRVNADESPRTTFGSGKGGDGGPGDQKGGDGGDGMGVVINMREAALTQEAAGFFCAIFGSSILEGRGGAGIGGKGGGGPVGGKGGNGMGPVFNIK
ncbi:hypothetical protein MSAN_01831200 [Mycena sanguinolenta]|uniref:Uncharacterized protein n=1 Tax=Mycena sanguinolenta TaxID=230812 RepID=A0A8H6XRU8_9AGAR|nr:hypothetical protein MSAN_01831200 [Mycena sanguinolenta]